MNKLTQQASLVAFAFLACACGGEQNTQTEQTTAEKNKLEQLSWVLGTWQNSTPDGLFTEHWEQTSQNEYTGTGVLVSPTGDTLFRENIKLVAEHDTLYYKPIISSQNDGKETVFTEKILAEGEVIFENPAHDFPQRIIYRKPQGDSLYARIEGTVNGQEMQEEYRYVKAK